MSEALPPDLSTIPGRILRRLTVVDLNPERASKAAGGSASLIPNILNGRSKHPRADTLSKIAPVLRTTAAWLMNREGPEEPDTQPPARGATAADYIELRGTVAGAAIEAAGGNMDSFRFLDSPASLIPRPPGLRGSPNAYAVIVRGDSQSPADPDGALRFVDPDRPLRKGDTVVIGTRYVEGRPPQQVIKVYRRRTDDWYTVEMYNPSATLNIARKYVTHVHRVLTVNELFGV